MIFYAHSDRFVETIQTLDIINMKDLTQKCQFYKITLKESLPFIPKVSRIIIVYLN